MGRIAIIIPGYNCGKYIKKCIDSILHQEYTDFKVYFIDDGSIDDTQSVVETFQDDRIIYIYQKNAGVSAARNRGLSSVTDEQYLLFVDADDWLEEGCLGKVIEAEGKENPDYLIMDWNKYRIRDGEKQIVPCCMNESFGTDVSAEDVVLHLLRSRAGGSPWGKAFKVDIIKRHSIKFVEGLPYAEDYLFNLEYLKYSASVYYLKENLYGYNCYQTGARAAFRKNLVDITVLIEDKKQELFDICDTKYREPMLQELVNGLSSCMLNLRHKEFTKKERKAEIKKIRQYLIRIKIGLKEILKSSTGIKEKVICVLGLILG